MLEVREKKMKKRNMNEDRAVALAAVIFWLALVLSAVVVRAI